MGSFPNATKTLSTSKKSYNNPSRLPSLVEELLNCLEYAGVLKPLCINVREF